MGKAAKRAITVAAVAALAPGGIAQEEQRSKTADATRLERIFRGGVPETVADLRAMQEHVRRLVVKVLPSIVALPGASGVIVGDGFVLSAGHVTRSPGRRLNIILHDKRRIVAQTLGVHAGIDAGMLKIVDKGDFPSLERGTSAGLRPGQWCLAIGHPGGNKGAAPARLARIQTANGRFIVTDATIQAGDSGGPLLDMEGRVIGIHSRIARDLTENMHVPIDAFTRDWDRLVRGEEPGGTYPTRRGSRSSRGGFLGVRLDETTSAARIAAVIAGSAAEKGALRAGDTITSFAGWPVQKWERLTILIGARRPGTKVDIEVRRGDRTLKLTVTLGSQQ